MFPLFCSQPRCHAHAWRVVVSSHRPFFGCMLEMLSSLLPDHAVSGLQVSGKGCVPLLAATMFTVASSIATSWRDEWLSATVAATRFSVLWLGCILATIVDAPLCRIAAARSATRFFAARFVVLRPFWIAAPRRLQWEWRVGTTASTSHYLCFVGLHPL